MGYKYIYTRIKLEALNAKRPKIGKKSTKWPFRGEGPRQRREEEERRLKGKKTGLGEEEEGWAFLLYCCTFSGDICRR